ncbi:MAG: hypothetical protein V3V96_14750 [Acidiferrobacterales bacterium]
MKYNPEQAKANLLPEDLYAATLQAEDGFSKSSGSPMLTVTATVWRNGLATKIKDYFVNDCVSHIGKLKKLSHVLGLPFDDGDITPDMIDGKGCQVFVKTQEDETGEYGDKNVVSYYKATDTVAPVLPPGAPPADDDIPF